MNGYDAIVCIRRRGSHLQSWWGLGSPKQPRQEPLLTPTSVCARYRKEKGRREGWASCSVNLVEASGLSLRTNLNTSANQSLACLYIWLGYSIFFSQAIELFDLFSRTNNKLSFQLKWLVSRFAIYRTSCSRVTILFYKSMTFNDFKCRFRRETAVDHFSNVGHDSRNLVKPSDNLCLEFLLKIVE